MPPAVSTVRSMTTCTDDIRIGRVVVPFQTASMQIRRYTDAAANLHSGSPYAFPAYDCYDGGTSEPARLTDGDFLSPTLLNVPVKIRSFYGLQRVRELLQDALKNPILERPLAHVSDAQDVESAVGALYAVLDDPTTRPWGVSGTTLSKVLHRKRPKSLVLHDRWVRACYLGDGAPVPHAKNRSWAEYMVLITNAIREDIASQLELFAALDAKTAQPGVLSHVRLLDILAWSSKVGAAAKETDEALPEDQPVRNEAT